MTLEAEHRIRFRAFECLLELRLSITTAPRGPYDDTFGNDGLLLYRYRGTDPGHRDNAGLRQALSRGTPLVYFHGLSPGCYVAACPVFIVGDEPRSLTFRGAVDEVTALRLGREPRPGDPRACRLQLPCAAADERAAGADGGEGILLRRLSSRGSERILCVGTPYSY